MRQYWTSFKLAMLNLKPYYSHDQKTRKALRCPKIKSHLGQGLVDGEATKQYFRHSPSPMLLIMAVSYNRTE